MRNIYIVLAIIIVLIVGAQVFNKDDISNKDTNNQISEEIDFSNGLYLDYDESLLVRAEEGDVVLFFHASWCPSCKVLDKSLIGGLVDFPEDLTILKLNYDKESELKKKYSIVTQHTLVQVDTQGNEITKWVGGNDLDSILRHLK